MEKKKRKKKTTPGKKLTVLIIISAVTVVAVIINIKLFYKVGESLKRFILSVLCIATRPRECVRVAL